MVPSFSEPAIRIISSHWDSILTVQHIPGPAHSGHHNVPFYLPARISPRLHRPDEGKTGSPVTRTGQNDIAGSCRVRHNFYRIQPGLLLQKPFQYKDGITKRTGNDNAMETGVLIGDEVVPGDTAS